MIILIQYRLLLLLHWNNSFGYPWTYISRWCWHFDKYPVIELRIRVKYFYRKSWNKVLVAIEKKSELNDNGIPFKNLLLPTCWEGKEMNSCICNKNIRTIMNVRNVPPLCMRWNSRVFINIPWRYFGHSILKKEK